MENPEIIEAEVIAEVVSPEEVSVVATEEVVEAVEAPTEEVIS